MCDRIIVIKKYYINLDYIQINETDAVAKICTLTEQIAHKNFDTLLERFYEVASIIKENWALFASFCKHIDIVTTIVQYLNDVSKKIELNVHIDKSYNVNEIQTLTYLTLYNVCPRIEVRSFLSAALSSYFGNFSAFVHLKGQFNEIILLEDSDLDAVISCLKIIENGALTKIWIQENIKEKFLWFKTKYFHNSYFSIHTFRSKKDLLTPNTYNKMSIVSIWSEDIAAAKNLAKSLNKTIFFINTHMDFYGGVASMPCVKIIHTVHTASEILLNLNEFDFALKSDKNEIDAISASKMMSISIYNLFYDGKWQKSTKTAYCKYDNSLWANATKDDIQKCVNSAQKGFENWSAQSIQIRSQILHYFTHTLICSGHSRLGNHLYKNLISIFYQYKKFQTYYSKRKRLEVTEEHVPLGIIILKEENESVLFDRLLKLLIAGNSVIVIHNANFYNFSPYCDIFVTCGMPAGVINMLSNDDTKNLELYLCKCDYSTYAKNIYSYNFSQYPTCSKQIILPLK